MRILQCLMCCLSVPILMGAEPWTVHIDFNKGSEGEKVSEMGAAGRTLYTKEQTYTGGQAAVLHARRGKEEFGRWGGTITFPKHLHKGDEVWWRVHTHWPKGMDYSASPRLKFMRIHTCPKGGGNFGYDDIYMNAPGSKHPLQFIYEGQHKWSMIGTAEDAVQYDAWECYEYYVKFDDKSVDDGGDARVRFWKNGKLLADITDRITLKKPDAYADAAFLFTYWNSSPWQGQMLLKDSVTFQVGETVSASGNMKIKWKVASAKEGVVYLVDPEKDWKQRKRPYSTIKAGETLTGTTSQQTATVETVLHTHPSMDIKMYVDDITVTTKKPETVDAHGNPYLGPTEPDKK